MNKQEKLRQLLKEALTVVDGLDGSAARALEPAPTERLEDRVERVGELAHLHKCIWDETGGCTIEQSRELRRRFFGGDKKRMRASANLFGTKDSGAMLYREASYGDPIRLSQTVRLTAEGERMTAEYRKRLGVSERS